MDGKYTRNSDKKEVIVNRLDKTNYVWFSIDGIEDCMHIEAFDLHYTKL